MSMNLSHSPEVLQSGSPALPKPAADLAWRERRDEFRARLRDCPLPGISAEEVEVHFAGMPAHYWDRLKENDLIWGLETIHGFLKLVTAANVPATIPFVNWRPMAESGRTQIMVCTWDRHGLLAKAAAAFSAVRLNILEAEVFTRADNVVLDLFCVSHSDGRGAAILQQLQEMAFLIEGALSEPPRFASVWACSRHKFIAAPSSFLPRILFDNDSSSGSTVIQIEAPDRLGLLYDILQSLADSGLNIQQAFIQTRDELAHDFVHVTNAQGGKVLTSGDLERLRLSLEAALTIC